MGRRLAWVGIALLAAYIVFIGGGWLGIYEAELRLATVVLACVVLAAWAVVAWRRPEWRPRSVLMPAILACLASLTISTLFSRVPRVSIEYLGYAILLAALYLLLVRLMASPFFRPRLVSLGTVLFALIAIEFVAFVIYLWINWWGAVGHLAIPPLRPNFIGLSWGNPSAILTMVALFAVPTAAQHASWSRRGVLAFLAIGIVVAVVAVLTASRAGWVGLGVAGLVGIVALVASRERRARLRSLVGGQGGSISRPMKVVLGITGLVVVVALVAFVPSVLARLQEPGEDTRSGFYVIALRIFAASPIVGTGLGTWTIQRQAFTTADQIDEYIPHAHDVPLQTLAEQGLVGAIAGAILIANLAWLVIRATRSADPVRQRWGWLTALGLIYFATHDLLDFYANMPAALFAAALPVAWLDAVSEPLPIAVLRSFSTPRLVRRATAVGAALVVISMVGLIASNLEAMRFQTAVDAANNRDWATAYELAAPIADGDGTIAPFALLAGLAADRAGDTTRAETYFQHAADASDLPEAWLNLAAEQHALGDNASASNSLDRALRLGIQHLEISMPAAELARELGDNETALSTFASALQGAPSLGRDPWWQADPARGAVLPLAIDQAVSTADPASVWPLELILGNPAGAKDAAAHASNVPFARLVIDAWSGDPAARGSLYEMCSAHPLELDDVVWCARVAGHLKEAENAQRFRDQSEAINVGGPSGGLDLKVVEGDPNGAVPAAAYNWPVYAYRVWGPYNMLVPSLVHLEFR